MHVAKKPMKKSVVHKGATWRRSCASHAYPIRDSGRNIIMGLILSFLSASMRCLLGRLAAR